VARGAREFSSLYGNPTGDIAWPGVDSPRTFHFPYSQYFSARFVVPFNTPVDTWTQTFGTHPEIIDPITDLPLVQAPVLITVSPCLGHFTLGDITGVDPRCVVKQYEAPDPNALQLQCQVLDPGESYGGNLCPLIRGETYYLSAVHWDEFDGNLCDSGNLQTGCSFFTNTNTRTLR